MNQLQMRLSLMGIEMQLKFPHRIDFSSFTYNLNTNKYGMDSL